MPGKNEHLDRDDQALQGARLATRSNQADAGGGMALLPLFRKKNGMPILVMKSLWTLNQTAVGVNGMGWFFKH